MLFFYVRSRGQSCMHQIHINNIIIVYVCSTDPGRAHNSLGWMKLDRLVSKVAWMKMMMIYLLYSSCGRTRLSSSSIFATWTINACKTFYPKASSSPSKGVMSVLSYTRKEKSSIFNHFSKDVWLLHLAYQVLVFSMSFFFANHHQYYNYIVIECSTVTKNHHIFKITFLFIHALVSCKKYKNPGMCIHLFTTNCPYGRIPTSNFLQDFFLHSLKNRFWLNVRWHYPSFSLDHTLVEREDERKRSHHIMYIIQ